MSGPLPDAMRPLTIPLSWVYRGAIAMRNARFDRRGPAARLDVPVISVGNLTAGGEGKTPFVRWLVERLAARGRRPVIALRGYGSRGGAADEALEHAEALPAIDVVEDPDRAGALRRYLPDHPGVDCVVLDDGFQHRRLHRDLDLVLLDATRATLDDRLLPAGFLREPVGSLRRADAVIVTRAEIADGALAERIARHHGAPPAAWARHTWTQLRLREPGAADDGTCVPTTWLAGRRVLAMFGVGNPASVLAQLRGAGAEVAAVIRARDHDRYAAPKLDRVRRAVRGLEAMVVTGKDWVKLRDLIDSASWPVPIVVPDLAVEIFEGASRLTDRVLGPSGAPTIREHREPPHVRPSGAVPMTALLRKLAAYRPFTVMVVGDVMLDQHLYGAAERLSPDAPVPVLHAARTTDQPGGAANVAMCLRALKGEVICAGVVGDDAEGRTLRAMLSDAGCRVDGIVVDAARPTTIKRSFIGLAQHRHPQKMFRVDVETRDAIDEAMCVALLSRVEAALEEVAVVCLEDYDKGVCSETFCRRLIDLCRARGTPVLVDPAAIEDYGKYARATAITPNRSEAELATGLDTPLEASELHSSGLATRLCTQLDLDAVVLTLDRHGALLEERGCDPVHVRTTARSVYDVTGAGDVVLAALAAARANGLTWLESVEFANAAAGLEVEVFGAQAIPFARVQRELLARRRPLQGKVRTLDELLVEIAVHREAGQCMVFTNGCFDVIHAGHVGYLREAKRQGDVLIVAVNADEQVRAQKGPGRPVYGLADRLEVLAELQCVDYLVAFEEPTVRELLLATRPDVYVKGGDYRPEAIAEHETIRELGLDLRVLAHRPALGSTEVIERMEATKRPSD